MRASRAVRAWRGLSAAAFATFAASISHAIADGEPPPAVGVLLALTLAAPVCVALAGRRFSWPRLAAAVGLSQFAFHALLLIGVGAGGPGVFAPAAGTHVHGIAALAPVASGTAVLPHDHASAAMWMAHAIAAVVTIVAFGRGEQAVHRLIELSGWRLATRLIAWYPAPIGARLPAPSGRVFRAHAVHFLSEVSRRGPPLPA